MNGLIKRLRATSSSMTGDYDGEHDDWAQQIDEAADRITAMKAAGDGLAGFAGHTDDCRAVLAAWGEIEACSCGYTDAWKQWKEASDGL